MHYFVEKFQFVAVGRSCFSEVMEILDNLLVALQLHQKLEIDKHPVVIKVNCLLEPAFM